MISDLLFSTLALTAATHSLLASAAPQTSKRGSPGYGQTQKPDCPPKNCPPVSGTFNITNFGYYAENFDWDTKRCLLYTSVNPNVTMLIYDPYTTKQTVISFPGITDSVEPYHISGIDYDATSDRLFVTAGPAETWANFGKNVTGPDVLMKWNPDTRKSEWTASLGPFADEVYKATGNKVGGFQDQAEDAQGNSYPVAAFGNIIAKVDGKTGAVEPFYVTPKEEMNVTAMGMLGIVSVQKQSKLIVSDAAGKRFVSFDISGRTKSKNQKPFEIKMSKLPPKYNILCDGLYAPPKYSDKILLCSDIVFNGKLDDGAIVVYGTKDGWATGEYLGAIINKNLDNGIAVGAAPTATVQIGDSIFINEDYFLDADPSSPPSRRSRTGFPVVDITTEVDDMVKKFINY